MKGRTQRDLEQEVEILEKRLEWLITFCNKGNEGHSNLLIGPDNLEDEVTREWIDDCIFEEARRKEYDEIKARNAEWRAKWPDHCQFCGGWGLFASRDWVPYGSTYVPLDGQDPCPHCSEDGRCGRCGTEFDTESGDVKCPKCGWNHDDGVQEP